MAEVEIRAGAKVDLATRSEVREDIHGAFREYLEAQERERLRGLKWIEKVIQGKCDGSGNITLPAQGDVVSMGPEIGWAWSVRRISVGFSGTAVASAFLNLFYRDAAGAATNRNFITSLSSFENGFFPGSDSILLFDRELMINGALVNNAEVMFRVCAWQAPAEMAAKLWA